MSYIIPIVDEFNRLTEEFLNPKRCFPENSFAKTYSIFEPHHFKWFTLIMNILLYALLFPCHYIFHPSLSAFSSSPIFSLFPKTFLLNLVLSKVQQLLNFETLCLILLNFNHYHCIKLNVCNFQESQKSVWMRRPKQIGKLPKVRFRKLHCLLMLISNSLFNQLGHFSKIHRSTFRRNFYH